MRNQSSLKPQDILVLAKLISTQREDLPLKQVAISRDTGLSQSEVGICLKRLISSRLILGTQRPIAKHCTEFLISGLRYVFVPRIGEITRGVPTAHAALPLSKKMSYAANDIYVWPHPHGLVRGQSISPLVPAVVEACLKDEKLYELLALIDALRLGRAREVQLAKEEIKKRVRT